MGRTDLDFQLARARDRGDHVFIGTVAELRWTLFNASQHGNWYTYNEAARQLNEHGATIPLIVIPREDPVQMGMFDKPQFLTGKDNGFVQPGDTFWLHNAKVDGTTNVGGNQREQVKLRVSHERDGEKIDVWTSGMGIVNQIKRMDNSDRASMPFEVRLDEIPSTKGNPTRVLTPADQDPPSGNASGNGASSGDDF